MLEREQLPTCEALSLADSKTCLACLDWKPTDSLLVLGIYVWFSFLRCSFSSFPIAFQYSQIFDHKHHGSGEGGQDSHTSNSEASVERSSRTGRSALVSEKAGMAPADLRMLRGKSANFVTADPPKVMMKWLPLLPNKHMSPEGPDVAESTASPLPRELQLETVKSTVNHIGKILCSHPRWPKQNPSVL